MICWQLKIGFKTNLSRLSNSYVTKMFKTLHVYWLPWSRQCQWKCWRLLMRNTSNISRRILISKLCHGRTRTPQDAYYSEGISFSYVIFKRGRSLPAENPSLPICGLHINFVNTRFCYRRQMNSGVVFLPRRNLETIVTILINSWCPDVHNMFMTARRFWTCDLSITIERE